MNGVTAIATILKQEGIEWIGCMPSNSLIEAAAAAGIRPIVCRQERTGVHMADGFSRINNGTPSRGLSDAGWTWGGERLRRRRPGLRRFRAHFALTRGRQSRPPGGTADLQSHPKL